jgi:5-methylcytosine-specific restriction endonuclease McrA
VSKYCLSNLSDSTLLRNLATLVSRDRATTAEILAHIAEVDARELYRQAAYPSMYAYCVGELRMSEDAAYKRIQAARVARRFPVALAAVADGRLHLGAVCLLAPHLTEDTADELLAAATHKTKAEIEQLLAERFPRPDLPTLIELSTRSAQASSGNQLAPGQVATIASPGDVPLTGLLSTAPPAVPAPAFSTSPRIDVPEPRARVTPLAPERYALQVTIAQSTHDKLRYAQELLGRQVPASDVAQVLDRALDALIHKLEKSKFAATDSPRLGHRRSPDTGRHIPAEVRRAVWRRDQGQCTFVSETGHRCEARKDVEFDHIDPFARGGQATVSGIRLRCRAHNQYDAERAFGAEFMRHKRLAAAETRAVARERLSARARGTVRQPAAAATAPPRSSPSPSRAAANPPARTARPAPPAA